MKGFEMSDRPFRFDADKFAEDLKAFRSCGRSGSRLKTPGGISPAYLYEIARRRRTPHVDAILLLCFWMGKPFESYLVKCLSIK